MKKLIDKLSNFKSMHVEEQLSFINENPRFILQVLNDCHGYLHDTLPEDTTEFPSVGSLLYNVETALSLNLDFECMNENRKENA